MSAFFEMSNLENYFTKFRENIISNIPGSAFEKRIIYADWAASGRLYSPIEKFLSDHIGPFVGNTHTETTLTGSVMTDLYHQASTIFKKHVNAGKNDILIFSGFGMTSAVNKLQRLVGLRVPGKYKSRLMPEEANKRTLVIVTHMEHHSNQTSWLECLCDVEILSRNEKGLPNLNHLEDILKSNKDRKHIIGSFTACSNVTGIITQYHLMAEIMHNYERLCFVDFAGSAPYVEINMHPKNNKQRLDAIFFSPHKFLGGPGSSGVLIFNKSLYRNEIPDQPGGGTVSWTNPWGGRRYFNNIEIREDGGTPGFMQAIRGSLAVLLKERMGINNILQREHYLTKYLIDKLQIINNVKILEGDISNRIGFISFYMPGVHHNLIVRLLNDRYGIQTRGGCSCAGTYGHILLNIDKIESERITGLIDKGNILEKPGWVRISLHPTMTLSEIDFIIEAIENIANNFNRLSSEYEFVETTGDFESPAINQFRIQLKEVFV